MRVDFRESFARDLRSIQDKKTLERIQQVVQNVDAANHLDEIHNLKKLKGEEGSYRIRMGGYRIGVLVEGDLVIFVRALPRKDIYRYFP